MGQGTLLFSRGKRKKGRCVGSYGFELYLIKELGAHKVRAIFSTL